MPTVTPIPPLVVTLPWPDRVSALQPVPSEVDLMVPPGVDASPTVRAVVFDPTMKRYLDVALSPREGSLYAAAEPLQLPLEPIEGDWWLAIDVESELPVQGKRTLAFRPTPIRFREMADILPPGIDLQVPQDFVETTAQGDQVAGGRVWRYGGGEVSVWWAPGPTKLLRYNNAVSMVEATYGTDAPAVSSSEELDWQGQQTAFLFHEEWPGEGGGPGKTLVVQGAGFWLYAVRVRATGGETIPQLLEQVWETFAFVGE
jgi:hypothetical protein